MIGKQGRFDSTWLARGREIESVMASFSVSLHAVPAASSPVREDSEPPVGLKDHLGALIDQAGRQRMLSHRAVMFLALARGEQSVDARGGARAAAQSFAGIADRFSGRAAAEELPASVQAWLVRLVSARAPGYLPSCTRFLRDFERLTGEGAAGHEHELVRLAEFVAQDLLTALNELVGVLGGELAAIGERERRQAQAAGVTAGQLLEEIEEIGARVRIISINALIQATRAGEAGAGFAVIANEIKDLAGRMQSATQRIMRDLGVLLAR